MTAKSNFSKSGDAPQARFSLHYSCAPLFHEIAQQRAFTSNTGSRYLQLQALSEGLGLPSVAQTGRMVGYETQRTRRIYRLAFLKYTRGFRKYFPSLRYAPMCITIFVPSVMPVFTSWDLALIMRWLP